MMTTYALVGVYSFGHSATANERELVAYCETRQDPVGCRVSANEAPTSVYGLFAAVLWPLYWSWTIHAGGSLERSALAR